MANILEVITPETSQKLREFSKDWTPEQKDTFVALVIEVAEAFGRKLAQDLVKDAHRTMATNLATLLR